MASTKLQIIVDAKDNASGVLGRIGGAIGSLGTLAAGAALAGVAALGAGLAWSVGQAMEAEDGLAALNAVIKSTGGVANVTSEEAQKLASSFQNITRFSDDAIIAGQSMLLTFTNIGSEVFPQATEAMLNLAQKFGSMEQASMMLGKALNAPVEGVTALRRMGIQLSATQEEQIAKFMAVNDIASAQRIILGELETQFGGLAVAAGSTAAGKFDILKNKIGEIGEQIGGALLPALGLAADKLGTWVNSPGFQAGVEAITGGIQSIIDVITPLAEGNTLLALQNFQHLLMNMGLSSEQIISVTEGLASIVESADKIGVAFGKMFSAETASAAGMITTTVQGLATAMEKIATSAAGVQGVVNAFQSGGAGAGFQAAGGALASEFRPTGGGLIGAFQNPERTSASIGTGLTGANESIGAGLANLANQIVAAITGAPPPVVNVSANLDGAQIANSVSVRLGSESQGLNRIGGHGTLNR